MAIRVKKAGQELWAEDVELESLLSSDSRSSDSEEELLISENASVLFSCIGGEPGLSVKTTKTRSWTPIAASIEPGRNLSSCFVLFRHHQSFSRSSV